MYDQTTIEASGLTFRVDFKYDHDAGRPWDNSEGHGPVREASRNYTGYIDKRPGERVLYAGNRRELSWVYDWKAACKLARADGWNAEPYDAPDRIQRAVQADFDFLRAWCNDQWCYVGVIVTLINDDGTGGVSDSLWGVETYKDYHHECARDIAGELAQQALRERAEALAWAERDVVTA